MTTTARTPEAPIAWAGRKATNGAVNERVVSSTGSSMRSRICASSQVAASPIATPPPAATRKSRLTVPIVTLPVSAEMAALRATSAVASFTRLSPSSTVTIRRGIPTRRAMAVAATASGGATTAPSAMAAASDTEGTTHQVTRPTASVETTTKPTESHRSASFADAKSTRDVRMAAA